MAIFYGTDLDDDILFDEDVSAGVTSNPPGLTRPTDLGDIIYGYGGMDSLNGGYGYDTIYGGDGRDFIADGTPRLNTGGAVAYGGDGDDFINLLGNNPVAYGEAGNDGISIGRSGFIDGGFGKDYLTGSKSADTLVGGAGKDFLYGSWGADLMRGGAGEDYISGSTDGRDTLIGGFGDDTFSFGLGAATYVDDHWVYSGGTNVIRGEYGGGRAPAFEGAGVEGGDVIRFMQTDLEFGGRGPGHLWLTEDGTRTEIHAVHRGVGGVEITIVIDDGDVRASDYTVDDFALLG